MKINAEWHRQHPMPENPTLAQRIEWHEEHSKYCKCRPVPEKLKTEIAKLKVKTSKRDK